MKFALHQSATMEGCRVSSAVQGPSQEKQDRSPVLYADLSTGLQVAGAGPARQLQGDEDDFVRSSSHLKPPKSM